MLTKLEQRQDYNSIIQKGQPFTDPQFEAKEQSLMLPKTRLDASEVGTWKKIQWQRAEKIFEGGNYQVF